MPLILSDAMLTEYEQKVQKFLTEAMTRTLDIDLVLRVNQLLMMRSMLLWMTDDDVAIIRSGDVDAVLALIASLEETMLKSERATRHVH